MEKKNIHMIGIGGSGMSGIARLLLAEGARISGSDLANTKLTSELANAGACIRYRHEPGNLPEDCKLVVISAAVKENNPELIEARRRGLDVYKYARMLGILMKDRLGIAVAGTHGKTTTSSMISFLMKSAGFDPSYVFGAKCEQLGSNSHVGRDRYMVVEACEYDRSYLNLCPRIAVILNIEEDHLDYYSGLDEIVESFGDFVSLVPKNGLTLVNACNKESLMAGQMANSRLETFGICKPADWSACNLSESGGCYGFELFRKGKSLGRFTLGIPGLHNIINALAALGVLFSLDMDVEAVRSALKEFRGATRRFDLLRNDRKLTVVNDYAHHPTEIRATLTAAREFFSDRRLIVVFQPHQHSRTRALLADFARSFSLANKVLVPDIYFVRDSLHEAKKVHSEHLVDAIKQEGGDALYIPTLDEIKDYLRKGLAPGDVLMCLGAGNVDEIATEFIQWS